MIFSLPFCTISQAQPEPKRPRPAALKASLKASMPPRSASMAAASSAEGAPPVPTGARPSQKKVWFHTPPALLRTATGRVDILANSSSNDWPSTPAAATALFRLST
ncbi:hypothetical protein D3C72_1892060 [compost metagenome]